MRRVRFAALLLCALASRAFGWTDTIFTPLFEPDGDFKHGQLGILLPSYRTHTLFVAYRHLIGQPFDAAPAKDEPLQPGRASSVGGRPADTPQERWEKARSLVEPAQRVDTPAQHDQPARGSGWYQWYLSCPDDAYETAIRTLDARIQAFGLHSIEVREWVGAQDKVHSHPARQ